MPFLCPNCGQTAELHRLEGVTDEGAPMLSCVFDKKSRIVPAQLDWVRRLVRQRYVTDTEEDGDVIMLKKTHEEIVAGLEEKHRADIEELVAEHNRDDGDEGRHIDELGRQVLEAEEKAATLTTDGKRMAAALVNHRAYIAILVQKLTERGIEVPSGNGLINKNEGGK